MDRQHTNWYFSNMTGNQTHTLSGPIPAYALYGEDLAFPDVLHCERVSDRASKHDWKIEPHRHAHLHQFFLGIEGKMSITLDGKTYPIPPKTLINIPRLTVHGFIFEQGTKGFVLTIPAHEIPEVFTSDSAQSTVLAHAMVTPATQQIQDLFVAIYQEHGKALPGRNSMLRALAIQLACHVFREITEHGTASASAEKHVVHHMARFETLLHQNMAAHWRISDYASALGLSGTHLNRICRSATGKSALKFVEGELFLEACRLLAYTRLDIAQVSFRVGFEDPSYFSRAFARNVGVSPKEYRLRLSR